MSANIKTCAKCGAKNFADFAMCFNCGNTTFQYDTPMPRSILQKVDTISDKMDMAFQSAQKQEQSKVTEQSASSEKIMSKIVDKLEELDKNIKKENYYSKPIEQSFSQVPQKEDSRQAMDMIMRSKQDQIERLERELRISNEKLESLYESRGKDKEAINNLSEQKRTLETQLTVERERFNFTLGAKGAMQNAMPMVLNNASIADNSQKELEIPKECVVYSGDTSNLEYLDYAKKQVLKIYPKITKDTAGNEDVLYYIPGEFKNPPVLVLNPDTTKGYARNLKLNLITTNKEEFLHIAANSHQGGNEGNDDLQEQKHDKITQMAAKQGDSQMIGGVMPAQNIEDEGFVPETFSNYESASGQKRITVMNVFLGLFMLLGLCVVILPFIGGQITGIEMYKSLLVIFNKDLQNSYLAVIDIAAAAGGIYAYSKYLIYVYLVGHLFTIIAGLTLIIACTKRRGKTVLKYIFIFLALLFDVAFVAGMFILIPKDLGVSVGMGAWAKVALDAAIFVVALLLLRQKGKNSKIDDIKPITIAS